MVTTVTVPITLEYLETRCAILEAVILDMGQVLAMNLPAAQPQLAQLGRTWNAAIDRLNIDSQIN